MLSFLIKKSFFIKFQNGGTKLPAKAPAKSPAKTSAKTPALIASISHLYYIFLNVLIFVSTKF
jgi:hypothetical protein